jgi:ABC transport system ATP-binding/permease protein
MGEILIGSAAGCDWQLAAPGVAPQHARLGFREGLYIQDLGAGRTTVDGRQLSPGETVALRSVHAAVVLGATPLPLTSPSVARLYVARGQQPEAGPLVSVGADPAQCHVVVSGPGVGAVHAHVDRARGTITDLGAPAGTLDAHGVRLPTRTPAPLARDGGCFFGGVFVPSALLLDLSLLIPRGNTPGGHAPQQPGYPPQRPGHAPQQGGYAPPSQSGYGPPPTGAPVSGAAPARPPRSQQGPTSVWQAFEVPESSGQPSRLSVEQGGVHMHIVGKVDLATRASARIGRLPECDIVLPYPQVSGIHATIARAPDGGVLVTDMGSTNGTYVDGVRLHPKHPVRVGANAKVFIGPYPISVDLQGTQFTACVPQARPGWGGNLVEIEALDLELKVPDRDNKGQSRTLLNKVTFKAKPGDLIALMGPSGAGKTTLLTVLNGYVRPTGGEVRVNGENLYAIYDALRGSIGYVPQDDIVHPELTVAEAVRFSAKLRLPPDYSSAEIERRVEQTLKDLGLESIKHLEIGKPEKKVLSGGQRKRVNIALELVTDPALLFLDEPTSGLAADDTVSLISLLKDLAQKSGKTIIVTIHQPAREEYEKFDFTLIMGVGGEPAYFGPTGKDSYEFFGRYVAHKNVTIDNPRDMFDLLRVRAEDLQASGRYPTAFGARVASAQAWRSEFFQQSNPVFRKMYTGEREPGKPGMTGRPPRRRVPLIHQFALLMQRYAIVKKRDRAGTAIMLAQAPIIGFLLAIVFSDPKPTVSMWCRVMVERAESNARCLMQDASRFPKVQDHGAALFFLCIAAIWFGTSNAAREIVSELAIYRRERMVNLSIFNYILSKFTLLSFLCIVQCTILLTMVYFPIGLGDGSPLAFIPMLFTMICTSMTSVALGLLLSTLVSSSEAAMALTPIALIPQVVLGGRIVPMTMKEWLQVPMFVVPARWAFQVLVSLERYSVNDSWRIKTCARSAKGVEDGMYQCALQEVRDATIGDGGLGFVSWWAVPLPYIMLGGLGLFFLITVAILLKRRDSI